ncbi:MAG: type II toxin-antitoxin system RelE/ParE family toxin [Rhodospirillaceae bacterium]|nr:type II toxin-antitoxin system RelE/ParE family toxin [Rhodospirillaceae bacterium]
MRVRISSPAYRDLANISDYLGARNLDAARRVGDRISRAIHLLGRSPYIGRRSGIADTRQYPVAGLPYLIIYRLAGDIVEVLKVFHTSRNPDDRGM